jgi:hypothetical protein
LSVDCGFAALSLRRSERLLFWWPLPFAERPLVASFLDNAARQRRN